MSQQRVPNYGDENIKTIDGLEHIRLRPGMYVGGLGDGKNPGDGIYVLIKEILDNSIDEFKMKCGKEVRITMDDRKVTVRDFGRGIPQGKLVEAVSIPNTGGKFDTESFQKSIGLNGVGTKAVNALSEHFLVKSYRDGLCVWARFEKGKLQETGDEQCKEKNGTYVEFIPDGTLFKNYAYNMSFVETMVKNYSYLNKGLALILNETVYKSDNGLLDYVNDSLSEEPLYPPIHLEGDDIEIVLTHGNAYGENIASFVNGQYTREGGTHLAAYREAIAKTLKEFFKKNYEASDCRQGVVGAISVNVQDPIFDGQAKTKLTSNYTWVKGEETGATIRSFVNDFLSRHLDNYLRVHKELAPVIEEKIKASQKEREEISGIQKKTRERNKRTNVYNKKLRDCRFHFNDKRTEKTEENILASSIFITEGDSASGTITKTRKGDYQAVFSLRGKPINCYKESRKRVAENEELNLLISALGVEDDIANLRYNKILVATDADDDGMHIRMLVLTFFMKYYPELIRRGHVYILQTPLFRVRNKKKCIYCYSSEEKEQAIAELKTGVEITRFKGLGEIDEKEFVHFIGPDMKADLVRLSDEESISEILEFYMGNNTLERQNFIRRNLRSEEELEDVNI